MNGLTMTYRDRDTTVTVEISEEILRQLVPGGRGPLLEARLTDLLVAIDPMNAKGMRRPRNSERA